MEETLVGKEDSSILKRLEILENLNKSLIEDKLFLEARIEKIEYIIGLLKPIKSSLKGGVVND